MFGSARGPTHPVNETINKLETRIVEARKVLDDVAVPRLRQHQECLDYYLLQLRCQSLTSALSTLTSATAQLPPIGHSLQSASTTLQKYTENHQTLQVNLCMYMYMYVCVHPCARVCIAPLRSRWGFGCPYHS